MWGMELRKRRSMAAVSSVMEPWTSGKMLETKVETFPKRPCKLGLERAITKRQHAAYHSGWGKDWLKIQCIGPTASR